MHHIEKMKVNIFRGIHKRVGRTRRATFVCYNSIPFAKCTIFGVLASFIPYMNNFWTKLLLIVWECEREVPMETFEKCFLCEQLKLLLPATHVCGLISPHEAYTPPANEKTKLVEFQRAPNFCFANVLIMNVSVWVCVVSCDNEQNGNVWKCRILFTTEMTTKDVPTWAPTKRKLRERNEQTTKFANLFRCGFDAWQLSQRRGFCVLLDKSINYKWFHFPLFVRFSLTLRTCSWNGENCIARKSFFCFR